MAMTAPPQAAGAAVVPELPPPPPPPNGQVLALLAALSNPNPSDHARHAAALRARDEALCASPASYGELCRNFGRVLACPSPDCVPANELGSFRTSDPEMFGRCCGWIELGVAANGGAVDGHVEKARKDGMVQWNVMRQMAGLLLKNAMVTAPVPAGVPLDPLGRPLPGHPPRMVLPPDAIVEIKHSLLRCVVDADAGARGAASTAVSRACFAASIDAVTGMSDSMAPFTVSEWKELVPFLLQCITYGNDVGGSGGGAEIQQQGDAAAEGALMTLRKLLEDVLHSFENSLNDLVPALLRTLGSPSERRRKEALACLNCLVEPMPGSLVVHMNDYLAGLSALAADPSAEVRQLVCRGIVNLLMLRTEYLAPHVGSVAEFMLRATSDQDHSVALEACEFWLTFASLDEEACTMDMMAAVSALLPRLVPQLLKGMVYPAEKIEELIETNALEEGGMDREEDNIAPVFHKSKGKGQQESGDHHDSDDDDSDDDDDDDLEDDNEWTLRKCSAASLDALSGMFGAAEVLPPLLPALQEGLGHTDQWVREASILALGAIADGCRDDVAPHLPQLHPFLVAQIAAQESLPQLRCIAAWTLGRYAAWTVDQAHAEDGTGDPSLVGRVAEALVGRLLDRHRKVQIAVCSALGVFVESCAELLAPFLEPIFRTLMDALRVYKTRSQLVLFDTLGVMAEYVGPAIGEGALPGIYVPPLLKCWDDKARMDPFDRSLLPLMECLAGGAMACGMNYQPWAPNTFEMAMSTIEHCTLLMASEEDPDDEDNEFADIVVCAADLVDGLVEGLGPNFVALVAGSSRWADNFGNVLVALAGHAAPGVRMSAFALLGDLARNAPQLIETGLSPLLLEAIGSIDPMHPNVCNNAVWAVGEVCVRCSGNPAPIAPHAPDLVQRLVGILMGNATDMDGEPLSVPGLAENAATAMGRLANVSPAFVAPELGRFLSGWCDGMAKISNPAEKRDAFHGFVAAIRSNPQCIQNTGQDITDVVTGILFAVISWNMPLNDMPSDLLTGTYGFVPFRPEYADLAAELSQLMRDLKGAAGQERWNDIEGNMPVNVRRLLRETYQI